MVFLFGLIALFVTIPASNIIYCVLMLMVFGGFTIFDFNRLANSGKYQSAVPIAASIFLDIFNVFLLLLSLFGGGIAPLSRAPWRACGCDVLAPVRRWVLAALLVGAALTLSGCGGGTTGSGDTDPTTAPVTFSTTTTTPTSTIATPTSQSYLGPNGFPIETGPFLAASTTTRLGSDHPGHPVRTARHSSPTRPMPTCRSTSTANRATLPGGIGMVDENPMITPRGLFYGD